VPATRTSDADDFDEGSQLQGYVCELTAHFYAMEARALAFGGDVVGSQLVLSKAVSHFERRCPEDDPAWFLYFDEAELDAEFSHCLRDTGRHHDAASPTLRLGTPTTTKRICKLTLRYRFTWLTPVRRWRRCRS